MLQWVLAAQVRGVLRATQPCVADAFICVWNFQYISKMVQPFAAVCLINLCITFLPHFACDQKSSAHRLHTNKTDSLLYIIYLPVARPQHIIHKRFCSNMLATSVREMNEATSGIDGNLLVVCKYIYLHPCGMNHRIDHKAHRITWILSLRAVCVLLPYIHIYVYNVVCRLKFINNIICLRWFHTLILIVLYVASGYIRSPYIQRMWELRETRQQHVSSDRLNIYVPNWARTFGI